jgi:hypothetical protein
MDENFIEKHTPRPSSVNRPKSRSSVTVTLHSLAEMEGWMDENFTKNLFQLSLTKHGGLDG